MRAYFRRRAWQAWHAGLGISPGKPDDLTFEKLAGVPPPPPKVMSVEQMEMVLRRIAVGHNAALAARAQHKRANDGD